MEVKCFHCKTAFNRPASQVRSQIFCSVECRKLFNRPMIVCAGCGVEYERKPAYAAKKYCTWECFKSSRWQEVACAYCDKPFQKRISEIKKAEERGYKHMCSRSCRNSATSKLLGGDGTWQTGGKYGPARSRGKDWPYAKKMALERDNYECQQCTSKENLEVHHWEPYHIGFDNRLENLVTLCRSCHQDKHEEYRKEGFYEDIYS